MRVDVLKVSAAIFLTLGIASTGLISSFQTAAAASSANLWAVPVNSRIDDGNNQILRLKFFLDTANPLEKIRITIDKGTPQERMVEFDGNGNILTPDSAVVSIDGSISFVTDGYTLSKLKGKFKILYDKPTLGPGDHDALAEIITTGGTIEDDAHFKLRPGTTGDADLVAAFFGAPNDIKQDKKYNAFVKEKNEGTGNADKHTIKIYLSSDNVLDGSDTEVGSQDVAKLKSGNSRMVLVQFELADDAPLGPAYLIVKIDSDDDVSESNENNNTKPETINVIEWTDIWPEGH